MSDPNKPPGNDEAPLLGYRSGIDERKVRPRVPIPLQIVLGFLGTSAAIAGGGLLGALAGNSQILGLIIIVALCGALGAAAFAMRENDKHRGWVLGIVLGIGIVGLLDGLCFIMLR